MSDETIALDLKERTVVRKGLSGLRQEGLVPAVIHDHGKPSIHVMGDATQVNKVYTHAGKHHPVQLSVGSKQHLALIKDVDFEPTKHNLRHVVFQAIKQDEAVEAEIPVLFAEVEIPAEKLSLMVLKQLDHVQVKALPKDLPDELVVDPSKLAEVGDHLTVADLVVPSGVTILTEPHQQIAIVELPKDQEAEANAAAAALAEDAARTAEADESTETTEKTEGEADAEAAESTESSEEE